MVILFFFFFSSRRRHTRCSRDWSSDVCSSDLCSPRPAWWVLSELLVTLRRGEHLASASAARSEERRVGKEDGARRARRAPEEIDDEERRPQHPAGRGSARGRGGLTHRPTLASV